MAYGKTYCVFVIHGALLASHELTLRFGMLRNGPLG